MINASDMSLGTRFEFTQDQFDLLCSDLSSFPLARTVAASSAVPIAFSPLTVRNHSGTCSYQEPAAQQVSEESRGASSRRVYKAAEVRSYPDSEARPHITYSMAESPIISACAECWAGWPLTTIP